MRVLVAAGGSGGHVFPALAVLEELRVRPGISALGWIGNPGGLEGKIVESRPWIEFLPLVTQGLPRDRPWAWPQALFRQGKALSLATRLLREFRPDVVLAMGGYPSVAPVLAAKRLGIPVALHEQNAVMGLANRFLSHFADLVLLSFPKTLGCPRSTKTLVTGVPIRPEITKVPKPLGEELLVLGGSLGSRKLLETLLEAAPRLAEIPGLRVEVVTGRAGDPAELAQRLRENGVWAEAHAFTERVEVLLTRARLVLSRAGASTLAELSCAGRPGILVPWEGAAHRHQEMNAAYAAAYGGFLLLREKELSPQRLSELLASLWLDEERLLRLSSAARAWAKPDAARRVVQALEALGKERS